MSSLASASSVLVSCSSLKNLADFSSRSFLSFSRSCLASSSFSSFLVKSSLLSSLSLSACTRRLRNVFNSSLALKFGSFGSFSMSDNSLSFSASDISSLLMVLFLAITWLFFLSRAFVDSSNCCSISVKAFPFWSFFISLLHSVNLVSSSAIFSALSLLAFPSSRVFSWIFASMSFILFACLVISLAFPSSNSSVLWVESASRFALAKASSFSSRAFFKLSSSVAVFEFTSLKKFLSASFSKPCFFISSTTVTASSNSDTLSINSFLSSSSRESFPLLSAFIFTNSAFVECNSSLTSSSFSAKAAISVIFSAMAFSVSSVWEFFSRLVAFESSIILFRDEMASSLSARCFSNSLVCVSAFCNSSLIPIISSSLSNAWAT